VELVEFLAGTEHDIEIRDMHDPDVAVAASGYGIRRVPAVVIDGQLVDSIAGCGPDEARLSHAIFRPSVRLGSRSRSRALHRRRRGRPRSM
jgi:hypothetical protein